jgi:hypothetical protein
MEVGRFATEPFAKKDCGSVQLHAADRHPEIELITVGSAPKTAIRVFAQICGKAAAAGGSRSVNRTGAAQLLTALLDRLKADELQDLSQRDRGANSSVVDGRHQRLRVLGISSGCDAAAMKQRRGTSMTD